MDDKIAAICDIISSILDALESRFEFWSFVHKNLRAGLLSYLIHDPLILERIIRQLSLVWKDLYSSGWVEEIRAA
jgi:hypothetical protein